MKSYTHFTLNEREYLEEKLKEGKFDADLVSKSASAAKVMAEFANSLPKENGLWQLIAGKSDIAEFGEKVSSFGGSMVKYAIKVSFLNDGHVEDAERSVKMAEKVAALAEHIPTTGGISDIAGTKKIDEFGENTIALRQIPMDLSPDLAAESVETLAADLLSGRREKKDTVRDELLHTVACKAAIKAGWDSDEKELLVLVKQVMAREDLKYCPHGRPICVTLSKKQLEKQFKRT